jgi:hypothetical protein
MMAHYISLFISPEDSWVFLIAAFVNSMTDTHQLALECIYLIKFDVVCVCGVGHDRRILLWLGTSLSIFGVWGQIDGMRG